MSSEEKELVLAQDNQQVSIFQNQDSFAFAQRAAQALASSELVPERYQSAKYGTQAVSNAMIAMDMANRVGMNPLMVMQNLYVVYGNPGWSAQYIRAAINSSGKFSVPQYEYFGEEGKDSYGCKAYATLLSTGERIDGPKVTIKMAKAEGWYSKKGSKWPNMPDLMLSNRAVTFFGRTYCPEVLMGMQAAEELEDIRVINPTDDDKPLTKADLKDAITGESERVAETETNKKEPPAEKPEPENKPAPKKKAAAKTQEKPAEKKQSSENTSQESSGQTEAPNSTGKQDSPSSDNPFTVSDLLEDIECAESIEDVNAALASTKGFSKEEQNQVLRAAGARNKQLAEAKNN